jgi:hypothetical protein
LGFGTGHRKWSLNDGKPPNFLRVVRVALGTGYDHVEGYRRAWRNGRVSDLPPENPYVTIRLSPAHRDAQLIDDQLVTVELDTRDGPREVTVYGLPWQPQVCRN